MILKGANYARVSDDEEEQSLQEQVHINLHHMESVGKSKDFEWKIEHTIIEKAGLSGGNANRPGYQKLLLLIKTKKIDFIVCKEVSRLSRSMDDFTTFLNLVKKNGVKLFVRGLDIDLNSSMGELLMMFLGSLAQAERSMNKERTSSSIRSLVRTKAKIHGRPMLHGFKADPNHIGVWIPQPEQINNIIDMMIKMNEVRCFTQTLQYIDLQGWKRVNGKPFTKDVLRRIFTSKILIGKLKIPGSDDYVDLPFGPQISNELFNEVQSTINEIDSLYSKKTKNGSRVYPLSNLLYSTDGFPFVGNSGTARNGEVKFNYRCRKSNLTYSCSEIENAIIRMLEHLITSSGIKNFRIESQNLNSSAALKLEKQIASQELRLSKIDLMTNQAVDSLLSTANSHPELFEAINKRIIELKDEKKDIKGKIFTIKKQIEELSGTDIAISTLEDFLRANLSALNTPQNLPTLRGLFRKLFSKITISPETKQINIFWNIEATDQLIRLPLTHQLECLSRNKNILEKLGLLGPLENSHLYKLTVVDKLGTEEIANKLGVTRSTISRYQKINGLNLRKTGVNIKRSRGVAYTKRFLKNGQIININSEIEVKRGIKLWRDSGMSYRAIAKILNDEKIPTKTLKGKWHGKSVHQILNPRIKISTHL